MHNENIIYIIRYKLVFINYNYNYIYIYIYISIHVKYFKFDLCNFIQMKVILTIFSIIINTLKPLYKKLFFYTITCIN